MKFKFDENLPLEAAQVFSEAGHDAATVLDEGLGGSSDARFSVVLLRTERLEDRLWIVERDRVRIRD